MVVNVKDSDIVGVPLDHAARISLARSDDRHVSPARLCRSVPTHSCFLAVGRQVHASSQHAWISAFCSWRRQGMGSDVYVSSHGECYIHWSEEQ